ncbi:hypothetical protein [Saccharothrix luteola]|uniref:hypothetical protein n=1 Tax=Saccharothrix luteola TaxID=2893018 RepID=UPI001E45B7F8|nr:hypothetical protein [Saccharothrix luteola]MCC8242730.1 hypothetical protein [Saccharothrix luteola]
MRGRSSWPGHLTAAPDFELFDTAELPEVEPFGLLGSRPAEVVAEAERWRDHLVEVETGLPPNPDPGARPRPGYDPLTTTLAWSAASTCAPRALPTPPARPAHASSTSCAS